MIKKMLLSIFMLCSSFSAYPNTCKELYLELMKKILVNSIYEDPGTIGGHIQRFIKYDPQRRAEGRDWPKTAHTMVGSKRLTNIQRCIEDIIAHNVPGDFIETGVWRGGSTIFMRAMLKAYDIDDRTVWVADSFEGLPAPDVEQYPEDRAMDLHKIEFLSVSLKKVQDNFKKYDLLDDQVRFLKGFFRDTIPNAPVGQLALLRLDGDMYESTMVVLENLYPKLSVGGYIIIDDWSIPECQKAVNNYRKRHRITAPIWDVNYEQCLAPQSDTKSVFWKKEKDISL